MTQTEDVMCYGDSSGTAMLEITGGTGQYDIQWDAAANNQNTPIASDLCAGDFTYTVNDENECEENGMVSITQPDSVMITVSQDIIVCPDEEFTLSAEATGGQGGFTYEWVNFGNNSDLTTSIQATEMIFVLAQDMMGCESAMDSVQVSVMTMDNDSIVLQAPEVICSGQEADLSAVFFGQDESYDYAWNVAELTSTGQFNITPESSAYYTLTVTDQCGASISDSIYIEVQDIQNVEILSNATEGCAPFGLSLTTGLNANNIDFEWTFVDSVVVNSPIASHTFKHDGAYEVELRLITELGCYDDTVFTFPVDVHPVPSADFIASTYETDITEPEIDFTNLSSEEAVFFSWNFDDGSSSDEIQMSHNFETVGSYYVELMAESLFGCSDTIVKKIYVGPNHDVIVPTVFTPDPYASKGRYYDPNDLSNDIFYPFAEFVQEFNMMIFNRWGELIFESNDIAYGWDGFYEGELSQSGSYAYVIKVVFEDGYEVQTDGQLNLIR